MYVMCMCVCVYVQLAHVCQILNLLSYELVGVYLGLSQYMRGGAGLVYSGEGRG